jgi:hypothetical protein
MTDKYLHINAFKPYQGEDARPGSLVACDLKDSDACYFTINQYSKSLGFSSELTFDGLYAAEQTLCALRVAYVAGKDKKLDELRNFLGVQKA